MVWVNRITIPSRSMVRIYKKGQQTESKRTKETVGCVCNEANQACAFRGLTVIPLLSHLPPFLFSYTNKIFLPQTNILLIHSY
ncbi:hypothetical protein HanIR_Chr04g0154341 [Helianthus annuus]|nr:hypothetical protein HanIR_Chr04g0154341 [Helianthus annuus]